MINQSTILTEIEGSTATIWLNRPEKYNALDIEMISGFLNALKYFNSVAGVRIIVIRGKGKSFCGGADLKWMQQASNLNPAGNLSECEALSECFFELYNSSKITMCLVQGSSFGGANGFVAAADISIAHDSAVFAFSEVRIGLLPATIAPYVIRKSGKARSMELMLSGRKFTAAEACRWGLIHNVVPGNEIERYYSELLVDLMQGAPEAQKKIKIHLNAIERSVIAHELVAQSASLLAETRIAAEAKEGISAFFEKRKPLWKTEQDNR